MHDNWCPAASDRRLKLDPADKHPLDGQRAIEHHDVGALAALEAANFIGHPDALGGDEARQANGAVRMLRGGRLKLSARDAARLLGLSHQRVHQLTPTENSAR